MIVKSALKEIVNEVLEQHDISDRDVAADLLDRLIVDFGDEIFDDEEESEEEEDDA